MITTTLITEPGYLTLGRARVSKIQSDHAKLRWLGQFDQRCTADLSVPAAKMTPIHVPSMVTTTGTPNGFSPSALPRRT